MEQSSKEEYDKFLDFCSISLKGENPKFLDLIKTRYAACDDRFRCSGAMVKLLEKTQRNMAMEESRKFVHLKEFLTKLKINTAAKWTKKTQKRKHSSDSETETTHQAKAPKLKDCSVVVTKFPNDDLALYVCEDAVDAGEESNSSEPRVNKTCSISDGDVSGALSIVVADDERVNLLKEVLGSGIDCSNDSPMTQFSEPSFGGKVDILGKEAVEQRSRISDYRSTTSHIPFSTRISSRKPVVYVDIDGEDDFSDDDHIEIGSVDSNDTDSLLAPTVDAAPESEKWQTEKDTNPNNQISQDETALSAVTQKNPRKKSTSIVDVKLSDSPGVLVILASSSCHAFRDFSDVKNINNQTEQQEKTHPSLTTCSEKISVLDAHLDTISHDTAASVSAQEDTEETSNCSFEVVLAQTPASELENGSPLQALISSTNSPEPAGFQNTVNVETEDGQGDVGNNSIPCEEPIHETQTGVQKENTLTSEIIQENQTSVQNLDALTSEVKGIKNLDSLTSEVKKSQKGVQNLDTLTSGVKESQKGVPNLDTLTSGVNECKKDIPNLDTLTSGVKESQKGIQKLDTLTSEVKETQKGVPNLDTLTSGVKESQKCVPNLDTLTSGVKESQKGVQKLDSLTSEVKESQKGVQKLDTLMSEVKESKKGVKKLDTLKSEVKESQKGVQKLDTLTSEVVKESKKGIHNLDTLTPGVKDSQKGVQNLVTLTSEVVQENQKGIHNLDTLMAEVKDNQKGVHKFDTLTCKEKDTLKSIPNADTLTSEEKEIQNSIQTLNTLVLEVKSSVVDKLTKRVPLLSVSKYIPSSSGSSSTKPFSSSFSKQDKAAQKPSSSSETKVVPSSLETGPVETADSADEFQKDATDHILDKNQLKQKRRVAKLEHLLESLRDEIEKCQDAEMTLDELDDDNAAYIYEDKLKRKFVAVWNKLCEVTERTVTTGRPTEKRVRYSGTRYQEINRRIEKFLNKKKVFPDFHDIKSIVKLTDKKCNLNLSAMMLNDIAREAFVDIGEMLQTRRHQDFIATFGTRQTDVLRGSGDPYLTDPEFRRKVDSNRQVAKSNLDSVIAKFTKLQKERFYGEEEEEPDGESEEDDDNKKAENRNLEKQEKPKDTESTTALEDVTTESIEADTAEAGDTDDITSGSRPETSDTSQQPFSYNPSLLKLNRSAYLLSPDKGKAAASSSRPPGTDDLMSVDQQLDASSSADGPELAALGGKDDGAGCNTDSVIVIDESPAKSQQELRKGSFEAKLNPFSLDKLESDIKSANAEKGNQSVEGVTEKRGPNIKFTARKPLHPDSGLASKSFDKPKFDDDKEDVEKCRRSSVYEVFEDDEDEDQSSDSTSDQDADDKCVDDDVDEIVMIIDRSESECDTVSTRDPSPISVVSLSSESFDDMADNWEKEDSPAVEATTTTLPVNTPVEFVSSPNAAKRNSESDGNLEKHQFLEAMGIVESGNRASGSVGLAEGVLLEKNKDTGEMSAASQIHTFTDVDVAVKDGRQEQPTVGSPFRTRHTSPVNRMSQESDDCIIICDTPRPANVTADSEETNHPTAVYESLQSVKKTLDFQLSTEKRSLARSDQSVLFRLPTNEKEIANSTEIHQLSENEKQTRETDKEIPTSEETFSLEMFGQEASRTDFPRATAEPSHSGIAEKLHSLNSLLQKISGSNSENCMLPHVSTDANHHRSLLKGTSGKTGASEVNMPETGNGAGTSSSSGLQDNEVCVIDGDMSNESSQTGIHIMDVCSIGAEPCDSGDDRSCDAASAPNTCEYFSTATLPPSVASQSQTAARNKTVAVSVESGVGDSCLQGLVLSHPDVSSCVDMKSTDGKYNSIHSTVTNIESSRLFQKRSPNVTDGDSQDSCIEIMDEFEEEAGVNSSTSAFPEPSKIFKQNSDSLFSKLLSKAADTIANQSSATFRQSGANEKKPIGTPKVSNCHFRSEQIKSSPPAKKNMNRKEPSDPVTKDLCESSSDSVIALGCTQMEAAGVARHKINVHFGNVPEKEAFEGKAGNYSSQTNISIVESFEQADFGNSGIETPEDKHVTTIIETSKDKHTKSSIETPKDKDESTNIKTPRDKHEITSIEMPKDKHGNINIETPKVKSGSTSMETHKDTIGNTSIEASKDEFGNADIEAHKDKIGNISIKASKDTIGNASIKVHKEKTGDSVHTDGVGNNEGNVHQDGHYRETVHTGVGNIESSTATVGRNNVHGTNEGHVHNNRDGSHDGPVQSSRPKKATVPSNSFENTAGVGGDEEMGGDDDGGEDVQSTSAENDKGIVHSHCMDMECDEENVPGSGNDEEYVSSISNKTSDHTSNPGNKDENVLDGAGINEENVPTGNVENNEDSVLDSARINEDNVVDGTEINEENVDSSRINEDNVVDGTGNNVQNVDSARMNEKNVVEGAATGINKENIHADSVENNEENVVDAGISEENVDAGNVDIRDSVVVDCARINEENVWIDGVGTIVQATGAENNEGIIGVTVAGINKENAQADENIITDVQADDAKNNGENVKINHVENIEENICVSVGNNVVDGSSNAEKIPDCSRLMDSAGEDKVNEPCDNIAESENSSLCDSHGTDNVGVSPDIHVSVQTAQTEDKCVVEEIVQNEQNRMNQRENVQSSGDLNNKTSQGLEVDGENGDDESVDLLSTGSPRSDVGLEHEENDDTLKAPRETVEETSRVAEITGTDCRAAESLSRMKGLNADSEDKCTEEKDLKASRGGQTEEEEDFNAECGNGHILEQQDLDGYGHTLKQLDEYSNSGGGYSSEQPSSRGGYTELEDLNTDHEREHASKHNEMNTDGEDSVDNAEGSLPIVLDVQSVRSLDIVVTQVEECSRNGSKNDTVTEITSHITEVTSVITESTSEITEITSNSSESTSNVTEKLASDKMDDPIRRYDEKLEKTDKRQDEEEAAVTDDVDSESASVPECQDTEDSINNKMNNKLDAEKDDSGKCLKSSSPDDEEISIIEELSSVKGVRHSDHSKEEDRRLVDQLLLDMGLKTVKDTTVATGRSPNTVLADEPGKSSDEPAEKAETEPTISELEDVAEKAAPEKESSFLPISSMYHASVFSVECESVESESVEPEEVDEVELSPSALCVQDPVSVEPQHKIKSRKRPYYDSNLELQSTKIEEQNSEKLDVFASSSASTSVIDVEILPPFKKPKAVDYKLINDVISSVLAEFPAGRAAGKFPPSSQVKQHRPTSSKTTEVPELVIDDDDDDDVVIMEDSSAEAVKPSIFPVALHENRNRGSSAAVRQPSSVTAFRQQSSLGRGVPLSANQLSFRKHQAGQALRNSYRAPQNAPLTSFQPHSQMPASNGKRFSFATRNHSSAFMRAKNSLTPTMIPGQNRSLPGERVAMSQSSRAMPSQRIPTSQSLPRLAPRVPIPSIQADGASELTPTQPKLFPGPSGNFANKRFQSPTSGYIRSPTVGHIRSPTAGNIRSPVGHVRSPVPDLSGNTFRPHMPAMSLSRKRTYMSSITPSPSSSSPSGVALRGSGRPTSYPPKQPALVGLHNTARHPSQNPLPPQRLQPQQFQHGSKSNTHNSRAKQQGAAGRVEIILGDSDDEGDFNNTSSGPRIVSVASLSTSTNSDTPSHNPSRVPGSRTVSQSHRPNKDIIVIPD